MNIYLVPVTMRYGGVKMDRNIHPFDLCIRHWDRKRGKPQSKLVYPPILQRKVLMRKSWKRAREGELAQIAFDNCM